jgi:hypothetical protein
MVLPNTLLQKVFFSGTSSCLSYSFASSANHLPSHHRVISERNTVMNLICKSAGALAAMLLAPAASAALIVYEAAGANAAAITPTRDAFRTAVGGGTTAGANGSFGGLRREINWDGVPDTLADPNLLPGTSSMPTHPAERCSARRGQVSWSAPTLAGRSGRSSGSRTTSRTFTATAVYGGRQQHYRRDVLCPGDGDRCHDERFRCDLRRCRSGRSDQNGVLRSEQFADFFARRPGRGQPGFELFGRRCQCRREGSPGSG